MKIAVLSDIHSNFSALEAVLADAEKEGVTEYLCLGDIIGYGGQPAECLELIRVRANVILNGNHEGICSNISFFMQSNHVSGDALASLIINHQLLTAEQLQFIKKLSVVYNDEKKDIFACHDVPSEPGSWEYLKRPLSWDIERKLLKRKIGFYGHTHVPCIASKGILMQVQGDQNGFILQPAENTLINPGSVGQPRDNNAKASYGILIINEEAIGFRFKRVKYDIAATQSIMRQRKLPENLIYRLETGE